MATLENFGTSEFFRTKILFACITILLTNVLCFGMNQKGTFDSLQKNGKTTRQIAEQAFKDPGLQKEILKKFSSLPNGGYELRIQALKGRIKELEADILLLQQKRKTLTNDLVREKEKIERIKKDHAEELENLIKRVEEEAKGLNTFFSTYPKGEVTKEEVRFMEDRESQEELVQAIFRGLQNDLLLILEKLVPKKRKGTVNTQQLQKRLKRVEAKLKQVEAKNRSLVAASVKKVPKGNLQSRLDRLQQIKADIEKYKEEVIGAFSKIKGYSLDCLGEDDGLGESFSRIARKKKKRTLLGDAFKRLKQDVMSKAGEYVALENFRKNMSVKLALIESYFSNFEKMMNDNHFKPVEDINLQWGKVINHIEIAENLLDYMIVSLGRMAL